MATFNYTTQTRTILADLYTPVGVYMRLRDIYPQSALMESSDYHGTENSRSFIGVHPIASIAVGHGVVTATYPDGRVEEKELPAFGEGKGEKCKLAISKAFNDFIQAFHVEGEGSECCGLYGFTTFNAVRYFENIPVKDTTMEKNDAPDIYYIMYKNIIVFDHFNNTMQLITLGEEAELDALMKAINKANVKPYDFHPVGETASTLTDEEHKANIRRCIQHCLRGDVFQIVVSRRFVQKYEGDDFKLYRALRSINPSPYLFYFDFGGFRIFGSSPETHNRIVGDKAFIDPIAGTTKRVIVSNPLILVSIIVSQSSGLPSYSLSSPKANPALLTRISICFHSSVKLVTAAVAAAASRTSNTNVMTFAPYLSKSCLIASKRSARRAVIITL